jgi:hypothetical protein
MAARIIQVKGAGSDAFDPASADQVQRAGFKPGQYE